MAKNKVEILDINQICNLIKANENTRSYIEHKYKNREMTEKDWKVNFKKDRLSY
jgi:hypothetical protein